MRLASRLPAVLLGSLLLAGCSTAFLAGSDTIVYDLALTQVDRPASAQQRYGPLQQAKSDSAGVTRYSFEDSLVAIQIYPTLEDFRFRLQNKTDHSIKLIWDEAAFVDEDGSSQRVMHSGVKYSERSSSQPASVVPRGGSLSDMIVPVNSISFYEGYANAYGSVAPAWRTANLLSPASAPVSASAKRDSALARADALKGKAMRILLPLEIQGVVNEYSLTFTIQDYRLLSPTSTY